MSHMRVCWIGGRVQSTVAGAPRDEPNRVQQNYGDEAISGKAEEFSTANSVLSRIRLFAT